jgi:hypothetical protein
MASGDPALPLRKLKLVPKTNLQLELELLDAGALHRQFEQSAAFDGVSEFRPANESERMLEQWAKGKL